MTSSPAHFLLSELNEQSMSMALLCGENTDVTFAGTDPDSAGLTWLGAACREHAFSLTGKDTISAAAGILGRDPSAPLIIVLISSDEQINLQQAIVLGKEYGGCRNLQVYAFCSSPESEAILDNLNIENYQRAVQPMKLRRIMPERQEIYHFLRANDLFAEAVTVHGEKWIRLIMIGCRGYGLEFLKAALWFCQMDGFFLRIDVYDEDSRYLDRIGTECPGVIARSGSPRMGEDYYELHIHNGISPDNGAFFRGLSSLPVPSLVFVDRGADENNIRYAIRMRSFYAGMLIDRGLSPAHDRKDHQKPRILTVVHDDRKAQLLRNNELKNFRGQYYQLECIGDNSRVYSPSRILDDPLEQEALRTHLTFGSAEEFEEFEYFRRSSMASAIHRPYRDRYVTDPSVRDVVEHKRWCAYMRSTEGYQYGIARDDLAKRHPSLTSFHNLSAMEREKDTLVNNADGQCGNS